GRQSFYRAIANYELGELQLAEDFNDLTADPPKSVSQKLAGKMAVISLDGNKFGERARKAGESADGLRKWDEEIREKREELLQSLLDEIRDDVSWLQSKDLEDGGKKGSRLRFEVLVWGGDDSLLVVPAWKGWWTLQRIYELTKDWKAADGKDLTHSAGLVFCGAKAPIYRVKTLAENLCTFAKGQSQKHDRERGDVFAYQVLESFDHIGRDLEEYLQEHTPDKTDTWKRHWILRGSGMEEAAKVKAELERKGMPMRKLHKMVRKPLEGQKTDTERKPLEDFNDLFDELAKAWGIEGSDLVYLHALELWGYLTPEQARG
ncbi:MAG: hypothetical protein KDC27_15290, partial [Acidobacteria bacterium]|nr:hypothetical protein [Acidobacteriota bacterium]